MALDGVFLSLVRKELQPLIGGRVEKIHQPSKEEMVFTIRTREGAYRLLFNTGAGTARVHITSEEIENPKVPPMFCMFMRKHLSSGKLVDIRQDGLERILYFDFDSVNEMGDICRYTLAAEIMGRHSNLILIDSSGKIADSIKRVGQDMSSVRMVLPGMTYTLPPKEKRFSLFDDDPREVYRAVKSCGAVPLSKAIMKCMEGISPVFAGEAEFYAAKGGQPNADELDGDMCDRLAFFLKKTAEDIAQGKNKFVILKNKEGLLKDFCFADVRHFGSLMTVVETDSACETLDRFFSERDRTARIKQRAQDLFRLLVNAADRVSRRTANQRLELKECQDRERLKKYGDLLMANIYRLEKGQEFAEVEDYYLPECPIVKIPLDKRLNPSQNVQKYYKEYRKAATAEEKLLIYLDSVSDSLSRAAGEGDIAELREELVQQGYLKHNSSKNKQLKSRPPLEFTSSDGYRIRVGRNNRQNDRLTCKESEKLDIWLHTKNIAGSHTVISCNGEQPPERTIFEAAVIAAYHSHGNDSAQVPVDHTLIKYVRKPNGAKPGMVIFTNQKTLYVRPDEELVEKLRSK